MSTPNPALPILGAQKRRWSRIGLRLLRSLLGGVMGAGMSAALQADTGLVTADRAPQAWLSYAALVKTRIEDALAADEDLLQQLRSKAETAAVTRIWVSVEGRISAVALGPPTGAETERVFQDRLLGLQISQTPPAALSWPIVLQLDWSAMPVMDASTQPAPPVPKGRETG